MLAGMSNATLLWLRQDLRTDDHPALAAAVARGGPVIPVYIWAPDEEGPWPPGGASRWWLHQSLAALEKALRDKGSRLILRSGSSLDVLRALLKETGADAVYWSRRYEPAAIARDTAIKEALREDGLEVKSFNAALLVEPWALANQQGDPYKVFTPFWKSAVKAIDIPEAIPAPGSLGAPDQWPASASLDSFGLEPKIDWAGAIAEAWPPGEVGAQAELGAFLDERAPDYKDGRDRPGVRGTSRLSPYLHFGEISPRRVWQASVEAHGIRPPNKNETGAEAFVRELYWREFAHYVIYHFPTTDRAPLRAEFAAFPWEDNADALRVWQRGQTGYPMVDAGMRELWHTGWMHNRVRMIVASFLVKHLLIPWQRGADWFWDTLVDADLANNSMGWQWTAGCGADAAPYFRIFNPITQGKKFDSDGEYVRRWVPELKALPTPHLHAPWDASDDVLGAAGVVLGETYPEPIIDHSEARQRALDAYEHIKK